MIVGILAAASIVSFHVSNHKHEAKPDYVLDITPGTDGEFDMPTFIKQQSRAPLVGVRQPVSAGRIDAYDPDDDD